MFEIQVLYADAPCAYVEYPWRAARVHASASSALVSPVRTPVVRLQAAAGGKLAEGKE